MSERERDLVNAFFRRHYPADYKDAWEMDYLGGGSYGRRYKGTAGSGCNIFPEIVCADGFRMSVQGHFSAYSQPRDDFAESYYEFEIRTARKAEPLFEGYCGNHFDGHSYYAYVPLAVVLTVIAKHGGLSARSPQ